MVILEMVTEVVVPKSIEKQFLKDLKLGLFNKEDRDLIEYWITEIELLGYKDYQKSDLFKMLNDHSLKGERQEQRSISLNPTGGRLIYEILKGSIIVKVIKITPDHDYN